MEVIMVSKNYEIYMQDMRVLPVMSDTTVKNAVKLFVPYIGDDYKQNKIKRCGSLLISAGDCYDFCQAEFTTISKTRFQCLQAFGLSNPNVKPTNMQMKSAAKYYVEYFKDYIDDLKNVLYFFEEKPYELPLTPAKILFEMLTESPRPSMPVELEEKLDDILKLAKDYINNEIKRKNLEPVTEVDYYQRSLFDSEKAYKKTKKLLR